MLTVDENNSSVTMGVVWSCYLISRLPPNSMIFHHVSNYQFSITIQL